MLSVGDTVVAYGLGCVIPECVEYKVFNGEEVVVESLNKEVHDKFATVKEKESGRIFSVHSIQLVAPLGWKG